MQFALLNCCGCVIILCSSIFTHGISIRFCSKLMLSLFVRLFTLTILSPLSEEVIWISLYFVRWLSAFKCLCGRHLSLFVSRVSVIIPWIKTLSNSVSLSPSVLTTVSTRAALLIPLAYFKQKLRASSLVGDRFNRSLYFHLLLIHRALNLWSNLCIHFTCCMNNLSSVVIKPFPILI